MSLIPFTNPVLSTRPWRRYWNKTPHVPSDAFINYLCGVLIVTTCWYLLTAGGGRKQRSVWAERCGHQPRENWYVRVESPFVLSWIHLFIYFLDFVVLLCCRWWHECVYVVQSVNSGSSTFNFYTHYFDGLKVFLNQHYALSPCVTFTLFPDDTTHVP